MLLMAADKTSGLLAEPEPFVLQKSLDDFYVIYKLNVYTDKPEKIAVFYTELHQNILDVFNDYDVQIMSPNYVADRVELTIVPKEPWYAPPSKPPDENRKKRQNAMFRFLKTTVIGGIVFMVPMIIFDMVITKAIELTK